MLSGVINGSNGRAFVCDAKMILLNYETCFDKLPGGAICDMLNVFFFLPTSLSLLNYLYTIYFTFHRALNYSETLKYFIASLRDLNADRGVCDGFFVFRR